MVEIDERLVRDLRSRDMADESAAGLARWLCDEQGLDAPSRPVVFGYFRVAFGLGLADLMVKLGDWEGFDPEGQVLDEQFDQAVRRLIARSPKASS